MWFNRRHRRVGHLFQGRFGAVVVEEDAGWQEVARYVHLNPVRVAGLGLDKGQCGASRAGMMPRPEAELVSERLRVLREFKWSSYRGYAGDGAPLSWVWREPLGRLCGGSTGEERRAALREYTERPLPQGTLERPWDRLVAGLVLGTEAFARGLREQLGGNPREQPPLKELLPPVAWERIVAVLEQAKGESWEQFSGRHGDWGRDAAFWLGRRQGRLSLVQLANRAGGMDYAAVGQAISRFEKRLQAEGLLRQQPQQVESHLSNVEM